MSMEQILAKGHHDKDDLDPWLYPDRQAASAHQILWGVIHKRTPKNSRNAYFTMNGLPKTLSTLLALQEADAVMMDSRFKI
jgi:hypothetical protein